MKIEKKQAFLLLDDSLEELESNTPSQKSFVLSDTVNYVPLYE